VLGNLAWRFILALGIIAALNQLHIAQNVLNAVLYAALACIAIVAVSGGGIETMSQQWEAAAARFDAEMLRIAAARNAPGLTDQASRGHPAPIRAVPPTEQPAHPRIRPSPTPSQTTEVTTRPAPAADSRKQAHGIPQHPGRVARRSGAHRPAP
jgi:hypothetical protein